MTTNRKQKNELRSLSLMTGKSYQDHISVPDQTFPKFGVPLPQKVNPRDFVFSGFRGKYLDLSKSRTELFDVSDIDGTLPRDWVLVPILDAMEKGIHVTILTDDPDHWSMLGDYPTIHKVQSIIFANSEPIKSFYDGTLFVVDPGFPGLYSENGKGWYTFRRILNHIPVNEVEDSHIGVVGSYGGSSDFASSLIHLNGSIVEYNGRETSTSYKLLSPSKEEIQARIDSVLNAQK